MVPRANWKGYLKLSLVSCAIALDPATSETARVRFNTINRTTGNRVKRQFIDPDTEDVVDTENQGLRCRQGQFHYCRRQRTGCDQD
jgi:DNA end-binding protein Ku